MDLANQAVDALSGGIAPACLDCDDTRTRSHTLLLDELTTYLDLAHQIEVLDLLHERNKAEGQTIVIVPHDINLASRYAHHLVAIQDQTIYVKGKPEDIVNEEMICHVFQMNCCIVNDPLFRTLMVTSHGKGRKTYELINIAEAE